MPEPKSKNSLPDAEQELRDAEQKVAELRAAQEAERMARENIAAPLGAMLRRAVELRDQLAQARRNLLVFQSNAAEWQARSDINFMQPNGASAYFALAAGREDLVLAERGLAAITAHISGLEAELANVEAASGDYARKHALNLVAFGYGP